MSHPHAPRPARTLIFELLIAAGLGLVLLAVSAWQQVRMMNQLSADWSKLRALLGLDLNGTPLGTEVFKFVGCQIALHIAFGLLAWMLAWLTVKAFDLPRGRRLQLLLAWTLAGVVWVLIANATLFPWSMSGVPSELVRTPLIGRARLLELVSVALVFGILLILFRAANRSGIRITAARAALYSLIGLMIIGTVHWVRSEREAGSEADVPGKPNLVLIGIDSLRGDVVGAGRSPGLTPHIDAFIRNDAQLFNDAITPLARTFPAWTSILTGRYPRSTGAREDLAARSSLKPFETLADMLRANGYHTIFATDEVRFSNIDRSFGFDQAITPTVGVADFLLGKANDLPLPNLIANSWLGKWMFPATYGNRAAMVTYRPDTFVEWIDAEFQPQGPTMLAVHLTLPHYPFIWADSTDAAFGSATDTAYQYSNAVATADDQFGKVMAMLERKGLLRNALVVLLSDHGEALGLPASDVLMNGAQVRELLDGQRTRLWGHGLSVLSPHQFAAFLALRGYGEINLPHAFHEYDVPVSLVDIAPTALDLLGVRTAAPFEGASLLPLIAGDQAAIEKFSARVRFTETGFRTPRIANGDFNERSVLGDAAAFFRMNPANGRLEVRQDMMPVLLADKERAAMTSDWLLAAVPNEGGETQKYVLVGRHGGLPRRFVAAPEPGDTVAYALWQALHEHYAGEMLPPAPRAAPRPAN